MKQWLITASTSILCCLVWGVKSWVLVRPGNLEESLVELSRDSRAVVLVPTLKDTCAQVLSVLDCFGLRQGFTPRLASNWWLFPCLSLADAKIVGLCVKLQPAMMSQVISPGYPICLESLSLTYPELSLLTSLLFCSCPRDRLCIFTLLWHFHSYPPWRGQGVPARFVQCSVSDLRATPGTQHVGRKYLWSQWTWIKLQVWVLSGCFSPHPWKDFPGETWEYHKRQAEIVEFSEFWENGRILSISTRCFVLRRIRFHLDPMSSTVSRLRPDRWAYPASRRQCLSSPASFSSLQSKPFHTALWRHLARLPSRLLNPMRSHSSFSMILQDQEVLSRSSPSNEAFLVWDYFPSESTVH